MKLLKKLYNGRGRSARTRSNHSNHKNIFELQPLERRVLMSADVTVDNPAATLVGSWSTSTYDAGFYGSNYVGDGNAGKGTKSATFATAVTEAGAYDAYAYYPGGGTGRSTNTPFDLMKNGTVLSTASVNQSVGGGSWVWLGQQAYAAGDTAAVRVRNAGTTGSVLADAVRLVRDDGIAPTVPGALRVTPANDRSIDVLWQPAPAGELVSGYEVWRQAPWQSSPTLLATLDATRLEYFDAALAQTTGGTAHTGTFQYQVYAVQGGGAAGRSGAATGSAARLADGAQRPYGGVRWAVPGTVQAEDYDTGGQNVSYLDSNDVNTGGRYRAGGPDLTTYGGGGGYDPGYAVNYWQTTEWTEYAVTVTEAGTYRFEAAVASAGNAAGGTFQVYVDGTVPSALSSIAVPNTNYGMAVVSAEGFTLGGGDHTLKIRGVTSGANNKVGALGWFRLTRTDLPDAAPTNLTATATSATTIDLSWTDAATNETGYAVDRATDAAFTQNLATLTAATAGASSFADTGLAPGTTYHYRVRATNAAGASGWSTTATATTASLAPATPTNLTAAATSATTIDLAWADNATNETGYRVERSTDNVTFATAATLGADAVAYADTGRAASTTYHYRVTALGSPLNSALSNVATATTPAPLSAATTGAAVADEGATYTLGLSAGGFGADAIDHWFVDWGDGSDPDGSGAAGEVVVGNPSSVTHAFADGLVPAAAVTVTARAFLANDATGTAAAPRQVTVVNTAPVATIGGAPATWQGGQSYPLTAAAADAGAADGPFTYAWSLSVDGGTPTTHAGNTFDVPTGVAGAYVVALVATDKDGAGSVADARSFTIAPPATPTGLTATAVSSSQVDLAWADAATNETGYTLDRATSADFTTGLVPEPLPANAASYSATGLAAGTTYYFRVRAVKGTLSSPDSNAATATTAGLPEPTSPSDVFAYPLSDTSIRVEWADAAGDEDGYRVELSADDGPFTLVTTTGPNVVSHVMSGLLPGVSYVIQVSQVKGSATSPPAATQPTTTASTAPAAPGELTGTPAGPHGIALEWVNNATNASGFEVTYAREPMGSPTVVDVPKANATGHSLAGLLPNTQYVYKVRAYNTLAGAKQYSAYSLEGCTFTEPLPWVKQELTATPLSKDTVRLDWTYTGERQESFQIDVKGGEWKNYRYLTSAAPTVRSLSIGYQFADPRPDVYLPLDPSTAYTFRIRQVNGAPYEAGYTEFDEATATTLPFVEYFAPRGEFNLNFGVDSYGGQGFLMWGYTADDHDGFKVERRSVPYGGSTTGPWTSIADVGRDTRMLEVTGHDWNSPSFTYRVTAWNANGTKVSAEYGAPNSDYDDPNYSNGLPPTNLDANLISPNGTIKLTYTDPGQRSFYALQHSEDGEHFVTVSYPQYQGGPPEALFTGGKPGSTSFFRMYAEAWGDKSSYTSVVSVDLPPLSPPTLLDVEISRNYVQTSRPWVARVRWSDVNLMAHEYEIEVKGEGKDWHRVAGGQYTAGYADLSGFAEGYAYEFRVRAVVKADSYRVVYGHTTGATGTYSDALTRTPLARPYAPRGLWAKPAADGATAVDVYWADHQHTDDGHVVVRREAGSGQWYQIVPGVAPFTIGSDANGWAVPDPTRKTTAVDETTFTDTTVKPLTRYQYQVFAANDMGASQTNGGYVEASAGTVDLVLDGLPEERTGSPNEHHAGAFIPVNDDDSDGDGIPDYADGFDWRAGDESPPPVTNRDALSDKDAFTPMTVTVPAGTDLSAATFTFNYSGSHPGHSTDVPPLADVTDVSYAASNNAYSLTTYAGMLRVWQKAANVARDGRALENGGDYVRPGAAYTAAQLRIVAGQPLPLWVEGIKGGTTGDITLTVHMRPQEVTSNASFTDSAKVIIPIINLTASRTGGNYGLPVTEAIENEGDPAKFIVLVNNDHGEHGGSIYDVAQPSPNFTDNTAPGMAAGIADTDLVKLTLSRINSGINGVLELQLSDPSAVRLFKSDGSLLYKEGVTSSDVLTIYSSSSNSYLAKIFEQPVVVWVEALKKKNDLTISLVQRDGNGTVLSKDDVHMHIARWDFGPTSDGEIAVGSIDIQTPYDKHHRVSASTGVAIAATPSTAFSGSGTTGAGQQAFDGYSYDGISAINTYGPAGENPGGPPEVFVYRYSEADWQNRSYTPGEYVDFGDATYQVISYDPPESVAAYVATNFASGARDATYGLALRLFGVPFEGPHDRKDTYDVVFHLSAQNRAGANILEAQAIDEAWRVDHANSDVKALSTQLNEEFKYFYIGQFGVPVVMSMVGGIIQIRSTLSTIDSELGGFGPTALSRQKNATFDADVRTFKVMTADTSGKIGKNSVEEFRTALAARRAGLVEEVTHRGMNGSTQEWGIDFTVKYKGGSTGHIDIKQWRPTSLDSPQALAKFVANANAKPDVRFFIDPRYCGTDAQVAAIVERSVAAGISRDRLVVVPRDLHLQIVVDGVIY